jgi:hypothetical protein
MSEDYVKIISEVENVSNTPMGIEISSSSLEVITSRPVAALMQFARFVIGLTDLLDVRNE